jgi:type II secretory pathway component PulF
VPTFRYTSASVTANGPGAGVIDAPDRGAAVRSLLARGITPAAVEPMGAPAAANAPAKAAAPAGTPLTAGAPPSAPGAPGKSGELLLDAAGNAAIARDALRGGASPVSRRRVMSLPELASFIRELATAVQAGLPMVPALRTLAKSGRSQAQREMLGKLIERVEQGSTLADACRAFGPPFSDLVVNLIRAGEASGRLDDVLHQAADLLEKDVALRRAVMSATLYPAILTVLTFGAVIVVTTFIVPRVLGPLAASGRAMPLPTQLVQGFANAMTQWWWAFGLLIAAALVLWRQARQAPESRLKIDGALLRIPLFGPVVRDATVARFTRTLGTLVKAGLPVLQALRLTGGTLTNTAMRGAVMGVCDQVASGKTIAAPLEATGMFPPLLVQIVSLGERSGRLPELLTQAATALDERTNTRVKVLTSLLPPILIVIVASIVGLVVAAIILPLLEMQETIG